MKPSQIIPIAFFFVLSGNILARQTVTDTEKPELWNRAVSAYSLGQNLVPGHLNVNFSMLSSKGKVTESHDQGIRCFFDEKTGTVQSDILWAKADGQDTTGKARAEQKKAQQKAAEKPEGNNRSMTLSHDDLPFALTRQPKVTVHPTTERKSIDNHPCQGFDFTMKLPPKDKNDESTLLKGRAWIDEERGLPLELSFAPDPLPSKVKSMKSTYTFQATPKGEWVAKTFTMEGSGGFLFIKKYFRSHIIMSDYFTRPEK